MHYIRSFILLALGILLLPVAAPDALVSICNIQGQYYTSPYNGHTLRTRGVVFADLDATARRGFFIQQDGCDSKYTTSNGLFVQLTGRVDAVSPGDRVEVRGLVQETYGRTELLVLPADVLVLSSSNPLPAAQPLAPPFNNGDARAYYEHLEGMHVALDAGQVVGPTGADGLTWLVRSDLGLARVFAGDPAGTGEMICVGDEGLFQVSPPAAVGDTLTGVRAALDYQVGEYTLQLLDPPVVTPGSASTRGVDALPGLTVATFNLGNLFDTVDDPAKDDSVLTAAEYRRRLYKRALAVRMALNEPALLAVQEVENQGVLEALIEDSDVLRSDYQTVWFDGPDRRGLDQAILYRADRLFLYEARTFQGCTALLDGLGPDGNLDPLNPVNTITCDTNGDGVLDGNRLFSRPPLVARFGLVWPASGPPAPVGDPNEIWVIANHWKSKIEDTDTIPYTLPRRTEQARFVAGLALSIHLAHSQAGLLVLGDLNDDSRSPPLQELSRIGLIDLADSIPGAFRYTYVNQGLSQTMDTILWRPSSMLTPLAVSAAHINADYPAAYAQDSYSYHRSSDHDPAWVRFGIALGRTWLPFIVR